MIKLENVTKLFQLSRQQRRELNTNKTSIKAVDQISFECRPGRVFSLLGPNGAGKTTVLRMIATILKPTSGHIKVNGLDVLSSPQKARYSIGFLTGSTRLYERLTLNELIRYFADLYLVSPSDFKQRKEELFTLFDLNDFARHRIGQLSTGMKQKVSIVRTMIHDPAIIVFDEPTFGLDVITAENIIQLIRRCKKRGKTILFSAHKMSEVDLLCDDLAIIHKGRLCYNDSMDNFRNQMEGLGLAEAFIKVIKSVNFEYNQ